MTLIRKFQNNFTTGAVSPGIAARYDLEKYASACEKLSNAVVRAHGGVSKRPGTEYLDEIPGFGRLFPFVYSVEQTYTLCFFTTQEPGDKPTYGNKVSLRVYSDGGVVTDDNGGIVEVATPYQEKDIANIKFAQSADVLFLVHPRHDVYKLQRFSHDNWVFEKMVFKPEIQAPANLIATQKGFATSGTTDTISYRVAAVNAKEQESVASDPVEITIRATWTSGATVTLNWDKVPKATKYEVYKNSRGFYGWIGTAESNKFIDDNIEPDADSGPKEHRDPFEDIPVVEIGLTADSSDVPTDTETRKIGYGALLRGHDGQDGEAFYKEVYTYDDIISFEVAGLDLGNLFNYDNPSAVLFFDDFGNGKKYMQEISLAYPKVEVTTFTLKSGSTTLKLNQNGTGVKYLYRAYLEESKTSTSEPMPMQYYLSELSGYFYAASEITGSLSLTYDFKISNVPYAKYLIHFVIELEEKWDPGMLGPFALYLGLGDDGEAEDIETFKGSATISRATNSTLIGNYDFPFMPLRAFKNRRDGVLPPTEASNKPGAIGVFQQRLIFGRTNAEPQTVWFSETGAFDSMAVATPLRDDSAITATVDSKQMNEIKHFLPLRDMLMFTTGAEFKITGSNGRAITPTEIGFPIQSYYGVSDVPPIVIGTSILFIQNSGRHVRDLQYTLQEDGYNGNEVSILAEHLIESEIIDWAYQQSPFSTVWVCLKNGKLLTLTYMKEQNIWAWSEHESKYGKFRSVCCIREGAKDNVYFVVERKGKFFIEHQVVRDYNDSLETAFFVDCGLRYNNPDKPIKHVTGLEHLAGEKISVLADGSVFNDVEVSAEGSFDLPYEVAHISAGLPYTMELRTIDPEIRADNGFIIGDKRNVVKVDVMLYESRALTIGPSAEVQDEIKLPTSEKWGSAPELFTGELTMTIPGMHRDKATITILQKDPVPCTVLGVCKHINIG